jgi:hypothetical protein
MKTLLTTTALLSIFLSGPALATPLVDSHDQNTLQTQIATMQQMQKQLAASIARAKAQAAAGAAASGGDAKATGGDADAGNANPQSLNSEGDRTDILSLSYADAPPAASPPVSPGAVNFPQHNEGWKILGPIFGYTYTGSASCVNSGSMTTALLYRDLWLQTVALYGVAAAAPQQAEYAKTVEAAAVACTSE